MPDSQIQASNYIFDQMWRRIEMTRSESEVALFYDLLFFGELLTKVLVSGLLAGVEEGRERHRYRLEYKLVRASGIGEWSAVLDDVLVGPASAYVVPPAVVEKRELTQAFARLSGSWQRDAIEELGRVQAILEPTRLLPASKMSLRSWFSDFAWLRNRTRGHGALKPETCASLVDGLGNALRLITGNYCLFSRDWAHLRRNLSGKYRVTGLAGTLDAFQPLKSEAEHYYDDGLYIDYDGILRRVPLVTTDADLTDIFVANGDYRMVKGEPQYEMLSYHTDARSYVDGRQYLNPPNTLPPSETEGRPALDLIGDTFTNLPDRIVDYIHRPALERELLQLLRNDRHPVVTLVGQGGVGKTSMAVEVLRELAQAGDFFAILWFSARDIDLLAHGPKLVQPRVLTKEEIATTYADLMSPQWRSKDSFHVIEHFGEALSERDPEYRTLFVFDNFETVSSPLELYQFIDLYVRLPNKVLITSRFRDFKADYPVTVTGMSRPEFDELLDGTANRLGIAELLDNRSRDNLYEESSGHPYVTRILLGEIAREGRVGTIERVMASHDEILTALFERTFGSIAPASRRVFLTLCNWRSSVPRLALEAALLRPANERMDVSAALDALQQSSLIEVLPSGNDVQEESLRVPLAAYVFGQKKLRSSSMKHAIEADSEIIRPFGATNQSELHLGLAPRVRTMLRAIAERRQRGRDVSDELAVLEYVGRRYHPALLGLARFYEEDGASDNAVGVMCSYVEAEPEDRSGWLRLANLHLARNDGAGEIHARVEAARLPDAPLEDISNAARTVSRHLNQGTSGLADDERRAVAQELVTLLESHETECDATDMSRLAWLYLSLGEEAHARRAVEVGLIRDSTNRHCLGLASKLGVEVTR
jgi:hypothetical protein